MMNFKIASRKNVKKYSSQPHKEKSIVISITDRFSPPAKIFQAPDFNGIYATKRLKFNDVNLGTQYCMTKSDAQRIAKFIKKCENKDIDTIIVHCEVGVSRSAGVCAAIMKYFNEDYTKVFKSKIFRPNIGCFRLVCEALELEINEDELTQLKEINDSLWAQKTKTENLVLGLHYFKSTTIKHILRHLKIKRNERRNIKK